MLYRFLFVFLFGFLFSSFEGTELFRLEDSLYYDVDFFSEVPKNEWDSSSQEKKRALFNDYLKKELVFFDGKKAGLFFDPKIKQKLLTRYNILLINNTYEHLVARPFVDRKIYEQNFMELKHRVFVYHILFAFDDLAEKDRLFLVASNTKDSIMASVDIVSSFQGFAKSLSDDPSAKQNQGLLGWLPWGAVVSSFQVPVFSLPLLEVSDPILTDFGYHLALVEKRGFSDYYYYSKEGYKDLSYKVGLRFLDFDFLKKQSSLFDSLLFVENVVFLNDSFLVDLFASIEEQKKSDRLFGNKSSFMGWLERKKEEHHLVPLFSINGRFFGLGWLKNKLLQTPASKISSLSSKKDFEVLINSLILESLAIQKGFEKNIDKTFSFNKDLAQNYKNILFHEYVSLLLNSVFVDSLDVKNSYSEGVFNNDFKNPKRAVVSEIKFSLFADAELAFARLSAGEEFSSLLVLFGGGVREPISFGRGGALGLAVFDLPVGGVSDIIKNNNGSFSICRVDAFLDEDVFSLENVYQQIEQKIVKKRQEEIKISLLDSLLKKYSPIINYKLLGL